METESTTGTASEAGNHSSEESYIRHTLFNNQDEIQATLAITNNQDQNHFLRSYSSHINFHSRDNQSSERFHGEIDRQMGQGRGTWWNAMSEEVQIIRCEQLL